MEVVLAIFIARLLSLAAIPMVLAAFLLRRLGTVQKLAIGACLAVVVSGLDNLFICSMQYGCRGAFSGHMLPSFFIGSVAAFAWFIAISGIFWRRTPTALASSEYQRQN